MSLKDSHMNQSLCPLVWEWHVFAHKLPSLDDKAEIHSPTEIILLVLNDVL